MYLPRPPRPKKTNIVRTRTGCHNCRARRRKCDETKPACLGCVRKGIQCDGYGMRYSFLDKSSVVKDQVEALEAKKWSAIRQEDSGKKPKSNQSDFACDWSTSSGSQTASDSGRGDNAPDQVWTPVDSAHPLPSSPATTMASRNPLDSRDDQSTKEVIFEEIITPTSIAQPQRRSTSTGTADQGEQAFPDALSPWNGYQVSSHEVPGGTSFQDLSAPQISREIDFAPDQRQEFAYLSHYSTYLSSALPPAYLSSISDLIDHDCVRSAVLALSASSLAFLQGVRRQGLARSDPSTCRGHYANGYKYYDSVLRHLAKGFKADERGPQARLLTTILCTHFEWESSNVEGVFSHIMGSKAIVLDNHQMVGRSKSGRDLLSGWAELQARLDLQKNAFRHLEIDEENSLVRDLIFKLSDPAATIFVLYADAETIHKRAALDRCMKQPGEDTAATMRKCFSFYLEMSGRLMNVDEPSPHLDTYIPTPDLMKKMADIRTRLDAWHNNLDVRDLPFEKFTSKTVQCHSPFVSSDSYHGDMSFRPLYFSSHIAARNYLYYAAAQLLASEHSCRHYRENDAITDEEQRIHDEFLDSWAWIIMRIVAGVDFKESATKDTYKEVGLLWIVWKVCESYPDLRIIQFVLDYVFPRMEKDVTCGYMLLSIAFWKPQFEFLRQQVQLGLRPYLINIIHPVLQDDNYSLANPVGEVWAVIHGSYNGGPLVNVRLKIR